MGLFDLFTDGNERKAADERIAGYNNAYNKVAQSVGGGLADLKQYYGDAQKFYSRLGDSPVMQTGVRGYDAYADAAGVNGADGMARARANFTSMPGYQEGLTSGLDTLDRRAAARGMLGSGNNNIDTMKYATDYANRGYGNYLAGLTPFLSAPQQQLGLAGAQANLFTGMGDKAFGAGALLGDYGWKQQTGIGDANAAAELAKDTTGGNILGALFGGVRLGGKLFGMG